MKELALKIGEIEWAKLRDAYGDATSDGLLASDIVDQEYSCRQDAVNELLWGRAFHQNDVFSVTPAIIQVVTYILEQGLCEQNIDLEVLTNPKTTLLEEIVRFLRVCAEAVNVVDKFEIREAIRGGKELFSFLAKESSPKVRQDAEALLVCLSNWT